jgi:hypothetical protein
MATFRHVRTECQCIDEEVNRRIFWLDSGVPGRVDVYLFQRRPLPPIVLRPMGTRRDSTLFFSRS